MLMPGRKYTNASADYRYGFNGKENDNEIRGEGNHIDFGERGYDPRIGRMWSVDPLADQMPAWSPYSYAFNSPIRFVDKDGEIPILPLLLKAGSAGAADWMAQGAMNYYFNPETTGNVEKSFGAVSWLQVSRSALEGLIPWKTQGGRLGRAAATAVGDIMVNAFEQGSSYSTEKAIQDFAVGFIGDLAGGGMGELLTKYGSKAVAKGLGKMGIGGDMITKFTGLSLINGKRSVGFGSKNNTGHLVKHAKYLGIDGTAQELQKPQNIKRLKDAATNFVNSADEVRTGKWDDTFTDAIFYRKGDNIIVTDKTTGNFISAADNAAGNKKFDAATKAIFSKEK